MKYMILNTGGFDFPFYFTNRETQTKSWTSSGTSSSLWCWNQWKYCIYKIFWLFTVWLIFKEETPPCGEEFGFVISSSSVCLWTSANWLGLGLVSGSLNSIATNETQGRRSIVHACISFFFLSVMQVWKLEVYLQLIFLHNFKMFTLTK